MPHLMPGTSLAFLLNDVARHFRRSFEDAVEQSDLPMTVGDVRALSYVASHNGERQSVLANMMGVEPMTMSAYLDNLEMNGLISRSPHPSDRRAKIVSINGLGKETLDQMQPIAHAVYAKGVQGISPESVQTTISCLIAMRVNLVDEQT